MSSASTPTTDVAPEPVDIRGHLAHNWLAFDRLPFVVNPEARPGDLLAWCWGEVAALLAAADVVVDSRDMEISTNDFSSLFLHRLRPLEAVLSHAVGALNVQQRQQDAADAQSPVSGPSRRATR